MPLGSAFKRPYGMRRMLFDFPGTKVPGCVQSFLWNEGSDFCRGLFQGSADFFLVSKLHLGTSSGHPQNSVLRHSFPLKGAPLTKV